MPLSSPSLCKLLLKLGLLALPSEPIHGKLMVLLLEDGLAIRAPVVSLEHQYGINTQRMAASTIKVFPQFVSSREELERELCQSRISPFLKL